MIDRRSPAGYCTMLLLGATLWLAAAGAGAQPSEQLRVDGAVKNALSLTVDALKAFPPEQITMVRVHRHGEPGGSSVLKGVRLTALLDRAALEAADPHTWKHTVVVASGTDGYAVAFSWPELYDTDVGADVLVVFERDGKPLDEREGRIALVSAKDTRTGPRSVHWLDRVNVRILAP